MRSELAYASPSRVGVRQPVRDAGGPVPPGAGGASPAPGGGGLPRPWRDGSAPITTLLANLASLIAGLFARTDAKILVSDFCRFAPLYKGAKVA